MTPPGRAGLLAGLALIMLVGCRTGPILDIRDAGIPSPAERPVTMNDVAKGIAAAGVKHGWTMTVQTPGHMVGTLVLRSHTAIVDVFYSTSSYSILYKDSSNLKYDASRKTIHSNYSSWIRNLHEAIQKELGGAGKPE